MKNRKQIASERRVAAQAKIAQGDRPKITGSNQKKMLATAAAYTARHGKLCIAGAFNLPAVDACPGAGNCKSDCYADQGRFKYRNVWIRRWVNWLGLGKTTLEITRSLVQAIRAWYYANQTPHECVYLLRIHDSGDFYSQRYVDAWEQALKTIQAEIEPNHEIVAYGYTKSLHLDLSGLLSTPGVRFVQSLGGRYDHLVDFRFGVSAIVPTDSEITGDWVDANNDPAWQDLAVISNGTRQRIALRYHGAKRMSQQWPTTAQIDAGIVTNNLVQIGA